eukprot:6080257-Pleurochrysis_carterae.AAC.1
MPSLHCRAQSLMLLPYWSSPRSCVVVVCPGRHFLAVAPVVCTRFPSARKRAACAWSCRVLAST